MSSREGQRKGFLGLAATCARGGFADTGRGAAALPGAILPGPVEFPGFQLD